MQEREIAIGNRPDLSVVVPTRNRHEALYRLMENLQSQTFSEPIRWELVVVNNGSTDKTQDVLSRDWRNLHVVALYEQEGSKSRALNKAIKSARGEILAFIDDDVSPWSSWIGEIYRGAKAYPQCEGFCGPVIPRFPESTPDWLKTHGSSSGPMFSTFSPGMDEELLSTDRLPFGCNFAMRIRSLSGLTFRLDMGPSQYSHPQMGEDTEFLRRVRNRGCNFMFLPKAGVFHNLNETHVSMPSMLNRAFEMGRAAIVMSGHPALLTSHKEIVATAGGTEVHRFESAVLVNYYCGQLSQMGLPRTDPAAEVLWHALKDLQYTAELLGEAARLYIYAVQREEAAHASA